MIDGWEDHVVDVDEWMDDCVIYGWMNDCIMMGG